MKKEVFSFYFKMSLNSLKFFWAKYTGLPLGKSGTPKYSTLKAADLKASERRNYITKHPTVSKLSLFLIFFGTSKLDTLFISYIKLSVGLSSLLN